MLLRVAYMQAVQSNLHARCGSHLPRDCTEACSCVTGNIGSIFSSRQKKVVKASVVVAGLFFMQHMLLC